MKVRRLTSVTVLTSCGLMAAVVAIPSPATGQPAPGLPPGERVYEIPPFERTPAALRLLAAAPRGQQTDIGHNAVLVRPAWDIVGTGNRGRGVRVAVLDSGADVTHPDLRNRIVPGGTVDFTGEFGLNSPNVTDANGHGTHCAGIVAAEDNDTGVVGVAPEAQLLIGRIFRTDGFTRSGIIRDAIIWAADSGADVISMSFGQLGDDPVIRGALQYARAKNCILVAAAGNKHPRHNPLGVVEYPGRDELCVCVAAFDAADVANNRYKIADFSGRTLKGEVDVAAPGVNVLSTVPGGDIEEESGTSMAAPYVAGIAALYVGSQKAAGRPATHGDFVTIIQGTSASSVSMASRPSIPSGWGRIQANAFVNPGPQSQPAGKVVFEKNQLPQGQRTQLEQVFPSFQRLTVEFGTTAGTVVPNVIPTVAPASANPGGAPGTPAPAGPVGEVPQVDQAAPPTRVPPEKQPERQTGPSRTVQPTSPKDDKPKPMARPKGQKNTTPAKPKRGGSDPAGGSRKDGTGGSESGRTDGE